MDAIDDNGGLTERTELFVLLVIESEFGNCGGRPKEDIDDPQSS